MARVLNARRVGRRDAPSRVYVGRPSKWGNPFVIGRDGTREEVVAKYRAWLPNQPNLVETLSELFGKDLICWCEEWEECHARDVLLPMVSEIESAGSRSRPLF